MKKLFLLFCLLGVLSACRQPTEAERMAGDLCDCMQPLAQAFEAIEELSTEGNVEALEEAMASMKASAQASEECTVRLEEQYGDALINQEKAIRSVMAQECPDVVRAMQKSEAGFE